MNVTNALNIYIGHLAEFHSVSTEENITMQLGDNSRQKKIADKDKPVVDHKKHKACRRKYMREYMKARQADDNLRKNENKKTSARQEH